MGHGAEDEGGGKKEKKKRKQEEKVEDEKERSHQHLCGVYVQELRKEGRR